MRQWLHNQRIQRLRELCQRYYLPLMLGVIATIVVLALWQHLLKYEQLHTHALVQQEAIAIQSKLSQELSTRILTLEQMASRWQINGGTPKAAWEADAAQYIEDFSGYQAIEWIDPSFYVRWVVPVAGNEAAQNLDLGREPRRQITLRIAHDLHQTLLTRTITLAQGGKGMLAVVPLFVKTDSTPPAVGSPAEVLRERFDGFIVGVFRFQSLFDSILTTSPQYQIQILDHNGLIYSQRKPLTIEQPGIGAIQAYGADWQVQVFPTSEFVAAGRSLLPTVVLWGGLAVTWTLALTVALQQKATRQVQQIRRINQQLQAEMSHRQQIEASLRQSEERWHLALYGSNDGIWDWNVKTNEVFFSGRWQEMLGFAEGEIPNRLEEWTKRVHPDDLVWVTEAIFDHFSKKTPFYITEHRVQCKDSSYKWVLDRGQALWDEAGNVVRMVGSHTDITERKQSEIALQESEARYQQLVSHMNAGFVVHAADTHILQCNTTACELLGLSMEQIMGTAAINPAWHFVREDGTLMPLEEYPVNVVLATQACLNNYILGINQADQSRVWVLVTAFPEFDATQQIKQVVVTFVDISPLKQVERNLQEMTAVMENAISGISRLDTQGRYLYVNKVYADLVGYQPEEMVGMDWQQTVYPDDLDFLRNAYQRMLRDGKVEVEAKGLRKDGSVFYKQLVMITTYNEQQQFVGHYCFVKDISDRKQAEDQLRNLSARLNLAVQSAKIGIWEWDVTNNHLVWDDRMFELYGIRPSDFDGTYEAWVTALHPDDVAVSDLAMQQALTGEKKFEPEFRVVCPDDTIRDIEAHALVQRTSDGQPVRIIGTNMDITEHKQAEAALRQSEATKQAIIQAIPDLLMRMHSDGRYIEFISNSHFNIINPTQVRQDATVYDVLPAHLAQLRMHHTQLALKSNTVQVYEQEIVIEGEQHYEEVRIVPLLQDEVLVMVRDITDRKQAEEDLLHQKEMFQTIVDHIPVMIALFDCNGHIEFVNSDLEQVLGWSLEEWQHQDVLALCYPDPAYRQSVQEFMLAATGKWQDTITLTASRQALETSWTNVKLSNGQFLGIGQDISDRKQKEAALRQAMEAAEAANLAKSMFLANMSHELRTPLSVILGFAQVMSYDSSLTPGQLEDLQTIRRSGDYLLSLINDVLDLSKIEAGHCILEESGFDLISLLHTLRTMMAERIQAKQLQLTFDITPEVPQFVIADEQKLRQVLLNLLSNAIKFTNQGSVILRVTSWKSTKKTCVIPNSLQIDGSLNRFIFTPSCTLQFEVIDTGVGIAAPEQESIFDAFTQAEAGRKSVSGTGLGLTISRKLLELMNGSISVESTPGVGSTFTVRVSVCPTSGVDGQVEQQKRTIIGLVPGQPYRRILVVDDQRENRILMARLLARLGLDVQEATNGQEAIDLWQRWNPDLTWMDIRMPVLDGYEATKQIRAMEHDQASIIIALTAQASQSDRTLALAAGCNDYISKPFREETLFLKMREYLGLEYLYADSEPLPGSPSRLSRDMNADHLGCLDPVVLAQMPADWLATLEDLAVCGNDKAIVDLATQLPPDFETFRMQLLDLANRFEFEQIVHLIHRNSSS